ncbi:MAG: hypothetical protein HQK60_15595, partial [Deltaproteobacteria bacterium]|nr:hypothetical protein [Deltaproteobacteria bacterium]
CSLAERNRLIQDAEAFLGGIFSFRSAPALTIEGDIDWRMTVNADPDWNTDLNRLDWLTTLLLATLDTGEGKYAEKASRAICHWQRNNPPGSAPWLDIFEVAQRAGILCWVCFLGTPLDAVRDEARLAT